jgi:anti-sigma-K factor RskA
LRHESLTEEGQEVAALYALGALSQSEARAFEVHIQEGCSFCQQQLDEFEGVAGALASSTDEVAPPAYLRDLLKVRIEKESESLSQPPTAQASIIPFPDQHKAVASATKVDRPSKTRTWLPWAVAASLLIALLGSLLVWRNDRRTLQASINESKSEQNAKAQELAQIKSILASPDQYEVLSLKATPDAPATMTTTSGTVYWNKGDQKWVVTTDLPKPPEGKVYQLWFVTTGTPVSAGLIEPDEDGHGFLVVNVPQSVSTIVAAAITLEPRNGSPQPTMPILAVGKAA